MDICMLFCVCCQVDVSATSWSLVQRSPADVVCDLETSWMRRTWAIEGCRVKKKKTNYPELVTFLCIFCVHRGILLYPSELEDEVFIKFYATSRGAVAWMHFLHSRFSHVFLQQVGTIFMLKTVPTSRVIYNIVNFVKFIVFVPVA
jgi:hypothetical protein